MDTSTWNDHREAPHLDRAPQARQAKRAEVPGEAGRADYAPAVPR
jgi:hypothetical protein